MSQDLVSIGLPVFNGERYLRSALDSLVAQTYGNFELIISDNASTDATSQIVSEYVQKDERIKYYKNEVNIGAIKNFNLVFEKSKGDYFMWFASDDFLHPTYIEKCVARLEQSPDAVMCSCKIVFIDENDQRKHLSVPLDTTSLSIQEKASYHFKSLHNANDHFQGWFFYGVYRPGFIRQTRLLQECPGSDHIFGLEIDLLGDVVRVDEELFYYRYWFKDPSYVNTQFSGYSTAKVWTGFYKGLKEAIEISSLDSDTKVSLREELLNVIIHTEDTFIKDRLRCVLHENNYANSNSASISEFIREKVFS